MPKTIDRYQRLDRRHSVIMISKRGVKERNKKKVNSNSVNVQNSNQLIGRRRSITQSSISAKQTKSDLKNSETKSRANKSTISKRISDKKSDQSSHTNRSNAKKSRKSPKNLRKKNFNNKKSNKSKIKRIKEIGKKVKTKITTNLKEVVKRSLRNNTTINSEKEEIKMKNMNNTSHKNRNTKLSSDTIVSSRDNEKHNFKNICQNSSKPNSNLCSKLFPTLNGMKTSNNIKNSNKSEKQQNFEIKTKLRNNTKIDTKINKKEEKKESEKSSKNRKMKTINIQKTNNLKNKSNSCSKLQNKKPKKQTQKVKENKNNNKKSIKSKNKSNKKQNKSKKEKQKRNLRNGPTVQRGHRLASLNAIAKVRLLCENESERNETIDESSDECQSNRTVRKAKVERKDSESGLKSGSRRGKDCKALVAVDNSRKQLAVRKRKDIDDSIEIIDTRSSKRMASLNATAIMAASYSPERYKRSKSVESIHSNSSVEMVREMQTISQTVSRFEISPSVAGINGVHVNHVNHMNQVSQSANGLIVSAQKHETISTVKQLKVSNKIKDRLLGIARLERNQRAKQKRKDIKNQCVANQSQCTEADDQSLGSGAEVSGFKATKVQVTKVTHINTQGLKCVDKASKDKKSGHKIDSILERDSSVVHKYQVQTKSTIEMQTTFNSSNGSSIANVTTITAPQQTPTTGSMPRMQVHISGAPAQVVSAPIMSSPNSGQSTYYNFPGAAPVVHLHNNQYQAMGAETSLPNPMSIINLSEPYPTHYSSAFSVPHFATHSHPTQSPFNYFHPGLYQPAGPLLQAFHDPCLIHKPIPFHPSATQVSHIHSSPQFSNPTPLQTQSAQTFANEMSQPFTPSAQFFHQLQTPIRPSQTVFFQAMPHTSGQLGPNATTFTLLNPGVHYTHPTIITSEQLASNENPILSTDTTYSNRSTKLNASSDTSASAVVHQNDNCRQHISKSIQCSPQSNDNFPISENQFCDSTNSSVRMSESADKTPVVRVGSQMTKKGNKSDKRKKSLLLKPTSNRKNNEVVVMHNNNSQALVAGHQHPVPLLGSKSLKNALTPSNLNKTNYSMNKSISESKNTQTVCAEVNISLPSVSVPSTPSPLPRLLPSSRKQNKKRYSHGWQWEGKPVDKYVYLNNEEQSYLRKCYPAIRHNEGDLIRVRDCVLLRSGPRKTDLPFVAKIAALWETPEGEMMMSLLWYYRPEHTDLEYYSNEMVGEIFASKHRDTNSVACIDDKCYVLTYNEFCRYKRFKLFKQSSLMPTSLTSEIVPALDEPYPRANRMPPTRVFSELVFCCRKVYDYRQKRILKNPI